MPEATATSTRQPHTWRPMAAWTAGVLLFLGMAWFVGAVAVPVWRVRRAAHAYLDECSASLFAIPDRSTLGEPQQAARHLGLYLRLPEAVAPRKVGAVRLLADCDSWGVSELVRALRSENPAVQRAAAVTLAELGEAGPAIPDLLALIRVDDQGGSSKPVSEGDAADMHLAFAMNTVLLHNNTHLYGLPAPGRSTSENAFFSLAALGPSAIEPMVTLVDSAKFRAAAAFWLSRQGEAGGEALAAWMRDDNEHVRLMVIETMAQSPLKIPPAVYMAALEDRSAESRRRILHALSRKEPLPPDAVKTAGNLLATDPDEAVRLEALLLLSGETEPLAVALENGFPRIRAIAAIKLGELGTLAASAIPALAARLDDQDPVVRACAATALGEMGPQATGTIDALTKMLKGPDSTAQISWTGMSSLPWDAFMSTFGEELYLPKPFWLDGLRGYGGGGGVLATSTRLAAVTALGEIGPAAARAIPAITPLLDDEDEKVRAAAAEALAKIRGEEAPR